VRLARWPALFSHCGCACDRFLAVSGSGANFPPLRSDDSAKADADDGVIIGNDDTRDAIRCYALKGKTEFAGERLRQNTRKS
jgi:hypothetical protein